MQWHYWPLFGLQNSPAKPMAIDNVKLINYLAYGIPQSKIAIALALTEGRISQLASQENVKELVLSRKAEIASQEAEEQATLTDTKGLLLSKINSLVSEVESLGEATRAYDILTKLSDSNPQDRATPGTKNTTVINMPIFVQQALAIEKDSRNQIIEIADRSMATLSTKDTYTLIAKSRKEKQEKNEQQSPKEPSFSEEEW